jgi:hypothetical protein
MRSTVAAPVPVLLKLFDEARGLFEIGQWN